MRLRLRFLPWNTVAHALLFFALTRLTASSQSASTPETHGVAPTDSARLNLTAHVDFLGGLAREPMIVEHPDGTLFVSGYSGDRASEPPQTVPRLWKSTDRGSTWNAVNVGAEVDGAIGNSDVDLAVSRDGTLYFVTMGFDNKAFEGKNVAIGVSRDSGNTWHWTMLSKKRFDDRPWVAVEPNGAAHVIWNDGNGVYHTVSRDRGVTWSPAQLIHPQGGSAHLAVGPKGELAVRITPASASGNKIEPGVELVAVSTDGGHTWKKHSVPGQRIWAFTEGSTPRWIEPLAWDATGRLYLLWTQVTGVWLARSVDRGSTWTSWQVQESEGDTLMYYPYLAGRGPGELAATWFSGSGESLRWQACKIKVADSATPPQITSSARFTQDAWRPDDAPSTQLVRTPAGEYLPVLFLGDGGLAVVSPIQNQKTNHFGFSFWEFKEPSQGAGKQGTQNPEAYALYLKGRSYWAKRTRADLETAVSYFNQAIAKDPGYALAYAGLADCYAMLPDYGASVEDIPKAKAAGLKALALDPTLSRPHVNLGGMKMAHEWDFAGGEAEFKKALELDPNDSHAHQRYADNLGVLGGREQDALAEINRAHQLDPLSLAISVDIGNVYTYARRFDEAVVVCKKVANENPTFADAHSCLANAYWGKKMYPQVIEEWKTYGKLTGERIDSDYAVALEQGFRSGGWKGALSRSIETLKDQRKTSGSDTYTIAEAYGDLDDKEQALQWLGTAFQEHDIGLMGLNTDSLLDSIRSDPRFAELVRKVGLPTAPADETPWPTNGWATGSPASVGVDEQVLLRLDKDMATGKYSQMIDSFAVFRCGKKVFEHTYPHDYAKLYAKEAGERGLYNERLTGRYNYFDPYWHPYYHGTDLHTMQSVSKTVTSVIIGAAMQRGDFKAGLDTPVLKYFDTSKVKNVDDRKRRITLRDLLTMTSGLDWNAEGFITGSDPQNDTSLMEASDDWVQYAIDKPMVAKPGTAWNYNDGGTVVLGYIFQKETGQDIDNYGQKYLFAPLGIRHEWKRTYLGVVDTEGGLYLNGSDLAKIGYLYLHDGMWDGQRIVSSEWVKESLTPYFQTRAEPDFKGGFEYGFKWWLSKLPDSTEYVWMARGFGAEDLMVFPNEGLIVTFTMWDILPTSTGTEPTPSDFLPLVKTKTCPVGVPTDAAIE